MAQLLSLTGQALRDTSGNPYTSAKAYFYETGTVTPKNTYSEASLTTANANPVIADGTTGIFPDIYLLAGRYKIVLQQSDGTAIDTWDPLDATLQLFTAAAAPSPAYAFLRYHNSVDGHVYRRNEANSDWIDEGAVDSLGNAATVTQQLAGTATDAFSTPDSVAALWQRGTDIASGSGATVSLPATGGKHFNITGTSGLTGISSAAGGRTVAFKFADACLLTHNATSFALPGGKSQTTEANDIYEFTNEAAQDATGSNWRCTDYQPASGISIKPSSAIAAKTGNYTATVADRGKSITFSGLSADATLTLPAAATVGDGFLLYVSNFDTSASNYGVTVDGNASETIDGFTTRKTHRGSRLALLCDGSNWRTVAGRWRYVSPATGITAGTAGTVSHVLGVRPETLTIYLLCGTGEVGYTAGDYLLYHNGLDANSASVYGLNVAATSTSVLSYVIGTNGLRSLNLSTGAAVVLTLANWSLVIVAEA